ncbi:Xaa-Pro peptidase family protein [Nocardioides endophyticus]|uniref:Xaa-Pro peptidase family protein n=1 Tax=Nocardioides endophyticus TaxID=1353775 RepID=A0ABP8Z9L2_9ACTN
MSEHHLVPRAEIERRVSALQARLRAVDVRCAMVTSEPNVCYLSGLRTPSFHSNSRPVVLVVPAEGPTVVVCSRSQAPNVTASAWVGETRAFDGFETEAEPVLLDVLGALGGSGDGRVAAELGADLRLGLSGAAFLRLRSAIGELVDAAPALWSIRSLKSDWEISALREAGRVNGLAFDRLRDSYRPGMTERDLFAVWAASVMAAGADSPGYLAMHSGPGNYDRVSGLPGNRAPEPGDLVWLDGGPRWLGYWSDITRTYSVGAPRPEHAGLYAASRAATLAVGEAIRPGLTTTELFDVVSRAFRDAGLEIGSATRIGHGVGLQLTEPPSVLPSAPVTLEAGMVLAIEPGIARSDGYFNVEENFLVTPGGAELLSPPSDPEILTLGA